MKKQNNNTEITVNEVPVDIPTEIIEKYSDMAKLFEEFIDSLKNEDEKAFAR